MEQSKVILQIENLYKSFGTTCANKNISLSLKKGEVRGLAGENGSGKSTLLSQVAGIYQKDAGIMKLNGEVYEPKSPLQANENKIAIVVQELGVLSTIPVGANLFIGRMEQFSTGGIINLNKMYAAARREFDKWGIPCLPLRKMAADLSIETRKMLELVRALSLDPQILILDEVTQSLSQNNREKLYEIIKKFRENEKSVLLITHDLEEMLTICDSITVLRDGEIVDTVESAHVTVDELKTKMVGRKVSGEYYREDNKPEYDETVILKADNISFSTILKGVGFELHKGEILGLCGLSDSGIHDVGKVIYGLEKPNEGQVTLHMDEEPIAIINEYTALKNKMAYVPKDRDGEALMMNASIQDNFCTPSLGKLEGFLKYLSPAKMREMAEQGNGTFQVKSTGIDQKMNQLSGGNKQKVNIGRWLMKDIGVLILDCPTRGVDVGVKAYIYQLMREAKKKGMGILLISDELTEILGMSDRLLVMKDGRVQRELVRGEDYTEEKIIEVMV